MFQKDGFVEDVIQNTKKIKILTDTGWSEFSGISKKPETNTIKIKSSKNEIICTNDHILYDENMIKTEAKKLKINSKIIGKNGLETIVDISVHKKIPVYDILNVEKNNRFYANNILVKNCSFISFDPTLIDGQCLARLRAEEPAFTMGAVRWYKKIDPNMTYLVHLDPSTGVGKDFAAIQIFEMPTLEQVGEWMHNKTPPKGQIQTMLNILRYINAEMKRSDPDLFWSFENNSCGEGILQLIFELGEEKFPGTLINEPKASGHVRKIRRGLCTTPRSKLLACTKLKSLIDTDRLKPKSAGLIFQLKNFIATGIGFAGKPGIHDDLVASTLGIMRMMLLTESWGIYDSSIIREEFEEEYEPLMPIISIF